MAIHIGVDINEPAATATANYETVTAETMITDNEQQADEQLPLMEEDEVFPEPEKPKSSFNPLWLILAGAALGAIAISASRQK